MSEKDTPIDPKTFTPAQRESLSKAYAVLKEYIEQKKQQEVKKG